MKRILCAFLILTVVLGLCACAKVNIENIVHEAEAVVAEHKATDDVAYKFNCEYKASDNIFCIYMLADTDKVAAIADEGNSEFKDLIISVALKNLDSKIEAHSAELSSLKSKIEPLFKDTDVSIVTMYVDIDGNVKQY